jgi:hypothetical protein
MVQCGGACMQCTGRRAGSQGPGDAQARISNWPGQKGPARYGFVVGGANGSLLRDASGWLWSYRGGAAPASCCCRQDSPWLEPCLACLACCLPQGTRAPCGAGHSSSHL